MSWQDLVLSGGQFVFIIALIPTITGKDKPAFSTSLTTAIILLVFSVVYASLSLWISTIFSVSTAISWLILAKQKYFLKGK